VPYILSKLHQATRLELVWDRYITDSLKGTAKAKWRKGVRRRVVHGWCNDPRELGQLPQSRQEQDRAVQFPLWRPPRIVPACREGAGHH